MKFRLGVLDCGYVLALAWQRGQGKQLRRGLVFRLRFPFPITLHSWRYALRSHK